MILALSASLSLAFGSPEPQSALPSMLALSAPAARLLSNPDWTGSSGRKSSFSSYYDAPASEAAPTRWTGAPRQFGYGLLGTLGGSVFGAAAGYGAGRLVGYLFLPDRPERSYEEPLYRINTLDRAANFGMAVGSVLGLTAGTGFMVTGTAQDNYVSPGFWTPTLGALAGIGVGAGVVAVAVTAYSGNSGESGAAVVVGVVAWIAILSAPSLGAVVADRIWAHAPLGVTMEPVIIRPGLEGARLSLRF